MIAHFVLATVVAALLGACASMPQIRGKACYQSAGGEICVGADKEGIIVEARAGEQTHTP